jgi:hypothetical protein
LIIESDASLKAVGASLLQEIPTGEGMDRRLIYAASRSFKGAETRYSTIRRELLGVVFAISKFRRFLLGREFEIRTDHRPLVGLLEKPLLSIENQNLRDLVEQLSEYKFKVTYIKGEDNVFPDYLSRNSIEELYEFSEFRNIEGTSDYEVLHKGVWKRYVFAENRRSFLTAMHSANHFGYSKMINGFKEMKVTWLGISQDIMEFLSDCNCARTENNRRRITSLGKPKLISKLEDGKSYALDLYTFGKKTYLSILHLKSGEFWSLPVAEKTAEEIMQILIGWSLSIGLSLHDCCFLTDRVGEFEDISPYVD